MTTAKKNTATKTNASSPSSLHPPYFQMISEAITAMKDRTGSSQPAIAKCIEENYLNLLPPNFKKTLSIQLKRFVKSEKLVKVKNSYKLSVAEKVKKPSELAIKETKKPVKKAVSAKGAKNIKTAAAEKLVEKAKKTKRLSQVKTPERLKNRVSTPAKRKAVTKTVKTGAKPAAKKAKK